MYLIIPVGDPASKSSKIEWKSGMDLSARILQNGNNRKRKRGPRRSFFQWFQDNRDPSADDIAEVCTNMEVHENAQH